MKYGNLSYLDELAYRMRQELGPFTEEHYYGEETDSMLLVFSNSRYEYSILIDWDSFGKPKGVKLSHIKTNTIYRKTMEESYTISNIVKWFKGR